MSFHSDSLLNKERRFSSVRLQFEMRSTLFLLLDPLSKLTSAFDTLRSFEIYFISSLLASPSTGGAEILVTKASA